MTEMQTARPPPRVIRVASPRSSFGSLCPRGVLACLIAGAAVLCLAGFWLGVAALCCGVALVPFLMLRPNGVRRRVATAREQLLKEHPNCHDDPLAGRLVEAWSNVFSPPRLRSIRRLLEDLPEGEPRTVVVICLGVARVPPVGDTRFEPEIIAPSRRWREMLSAAIYAALMGVLGFNCLSGLAGWRYSPLLGSLASALVFVGLIGVFWIAQTVLFPEYIRFAPGLVQILHYGPRRSKPGVVNYPMSAGTIAIVTNSFGLWRNRLSLVIARGRQVDQLRFAEVTGSAAAVEGMWQALLSTAPTPPLSDEELVG